MSASRATTAARCECSLAKIGSVEAVPTVASMRLCGALLGATFPRRNDAVSAGDDHNSSRIGSSHITEREQPAISKLVTSSPISGSTTVIPAASSKTDT